MTNRKYTHSDHGKEDENSNFGENHFVDRAVEITTAVLGRGPIFYTIPEL
jgi:hypothetical protein